MRLIMKLKVAIILNVMLSVLLTIFIIKYIKQKKNIDKLWEIASYSAESSFDAFITTEEDYIYTLFTSNMGTLVYLLPYTSFNEKSITYVFLEFYEKILYKTYDIKQYEFELREILKLIIVKDRVVFELIQQLNSNYTNSERLDFATS